MIANIKMIKFRFLSFLVSSLSFCGNQATFMEAFVHAYSFKQQFFIVYLFKFVNNQIYEVYVNNAIV